MANPHLLQPKERKLHFRFQGKYVRGKRNSVADFLSCNPTLKLDPTATDINLDDDLTEAMAAFIIVMVEHEASIKRTAIDDPIYQLLPVKVLAGDWHQQKSREVAGLCPFYGLVVVLDLVMYMFKQGGYPPCRPGGPPSANSANLHTGHQGIDSYVAESQVVGLLAGNQG